MVSKTLQWIGLASVVGVLAVGVGSLALVKDRLNIVIQDSEAVAAAPDPLALVKDELGQLHGDLDAIAKSLGTNLRELSEVLGRQAAEQERLAAALAKVGDAIARPAPDRSAEVLAGIVRRLAELQKEIAKLQSAGPAGSAESPGALEPENPTKTAAEPKSDPVTAGAGASAVPTEKPEVVAKPTPGAEPPASSVGKSAGTSPTKKPAKKPKFLSFQLPSRSFRFDVRQRFRILGSLSRVGFDAKSTLHDFSGVTSKVDGEFVANLASATPAWSGTIRADAASLRTGFEDRDSGMFERLDVEKHKSVEFEIRGFQIADQGLALSAKKVRGTIRGRMTIRGKTRDLSMPVEISVDASRRVVIAGQTALKLTDYDVDVPNQLGLVTMEDEVKLWVALRARSVGVVSK